MPTDLKCLIDQRLSYAVIRITGTLDAAGAIRLRNGLLGCLAEQPEALIVDLTDMRLAPRQALSVFAAVGRQAATWPQVPMFLCGPTPEVADLLGRGPVDWHTAVVRDVGTAVRSLARDRAPVAAALAEDLLPVEGASRRAREMATEACLRWQLPTLAGPTCTVATELVNNVVAHAHTMMRLRLSARRRYVHIAVADGSTEPPVLRGDMPPAALWGHGLALVDAVAAHWGSLAIEGGKVVWATLDIRTRLRSDRLSAIHDQRRRSPESG
jgi:anti-anti-sigma regulatory factor